MKHSKLLLFIAITLQLSCNQSAYGAEEEKADSQSGKNQTTTTLKGSVVEVQVTLNDLRDARLSISRVRKATANLFDEVSRQQMAMNFNPDLVGTTVLLRPTKAHFGPLLPPRKKWIDASMAEIAPIMKLFKEDVEAAIESNRRTDVSEAARESLDPLREEVFAQVKQAFATFQKLENATAGPTYNNGAIANYATDLDNNVKQLDKTLRRGIKILQREAKAAKKARRA